MITAQPPPPVAKSPKPSTQAQLASLLRTAIALAMLYGVLRFGFSRVHGMGDGKWIKLVTVLSAPLLWLLAVAFHEMGHVLGGKLIGGRFIFWMTGPILLQRGPSGLRLRWNSQVNLLGGMASCLPVDLKLMTRKRMAFMVVAGPLASALLALLSLAFALTVASFQNQVPAWVVLLKHQSVFLGGFSALIFALTSMPGTALGLKSDGKRAFDLLKPGAASDQELALLLLHAAGLSGQRPSSYDPALVAKSLSLNDGSLFDISAHSVAYFYAADNKDWPAAKAHLDLVIENEATTPLAAPVIRAEYAWLLATQGNDPALARAWLDSAKPSLLFPHARLRAEAAVLLAAGEPAMALKKAEEALHVLKEKNLSPFISPWAQEMTLELIQRARLAGSDASKKSTQGTVDPIALES